MGPIDPCTHKVDGVLGFRVSGLGEHDAEVGSLGFMV